jgi:serine/threonine protein kinase
MSDSTPNAAASDAPGSGTVVGPQDSPPAHLLAVTPATEPDFVPGVLAGTVLGPGAGDRYRLSEEIARGGMGVVYLARDLALDRDVGIKTLLHPPADGSGIVRRFREEARITGQLQHPGIPPVHDLGALPDGRPFLAMKLIKGRTLGELLRDRPDPSADRGRFVAAFEQVAQAVAYAHAHGVIHRDLKPGNVMVGAFGEVQVMDWGLAKLLTDHRDEPTAGPAPGTEVRSPRDADEATEAGTVLGTPNYMPPEQAIGAVDQIDARSDVFGLGGVLCAILTGVPPYRGSDPEATRQRAARARLEDARGRLSACGAEPELVALCERCLSPEKPDRPRDAGEVADAVRRLRAAAEERARRAELDRERAEVRAAEQRKRRRVLQVAGGLIAAVLVLGIIGTTIGLLRANDAADKERAAKLFAQGETEKALVAAAKEKAANEQAQREKAVALAVRDFLQQRLLRQVSPWEHAGWAFAGQPRPSRERRSPTMRDLLDRAASEFAPELLARKFPGQPLVQAEILETIGETYEGLAVFPRALTFMKAAHALREEHLGPNHATTMVSLVNLASVNVAASQYSDAIRLMTTLLDRLEAIVRDLPEEGGESPGRTEALATIDAVQRRLEQRARADAFTYPGVDLGPLEKARLIPPAMQALLRTQRLAGLIRQRFGPMDRRTLMADAGVGFSYHLMGQVRTACTTYEDVLSRARQVFPPDDSVLLGLQEVLVHTYLTLGIHRERCVQLLESVSQTKARALGADHPATLVTLHSLAALYQDAGRLAEAIILLTQVLDTSVKRLGASDDATLNTAVSLNAAYQAAGRSPEAAAIFNQVRDAQVKNGIQHPDTLSLLSRLGAEARKTGRLPEAIALYEQVREAQVRTLGAGHRDLLPTLMNLALATRDAMMLPRSCEAWEEIRALGQIHFGVHNTGTFDAQNHLGLTLLMMGEFAEAERHLLASWDALCRAKDVPPDWRFGYALRLVCLYAEWGRARETARWRAEVEAIGGDWPGWFEQLEWQMEKASRFRAAAVAARGLLALKKRNQPEHWTTFHVQSLLGGTLLAQARTTRKDKGLASLLVAANLYCQAEPLLVGGYEGLKAREKAIPPQGREYLPNALDRLIELSAALNRPDEVKKYRTERAKYPNVAPPPRELRRP